MESIRRETVFPGGELVYVHTEKFKTCYMSVSFVRRLDEREAAMNALLPSVLLRGTEKYPDMQSFSAQLDGLYGAEISVSLRKKGERQIFGFSADYVDEKFVGEPLTERIASLLGQLLLNPAPGENGGLREDYFSGEKKNLLDEIASQINDKRLYSLNRLIATMFAGEPYGVDKLGSPASAEALTREALEKHRELLLRESPMIIYFCGSVDFTRVRDAIVSAFEGLKRGSIHDAGRDVVLKRAAEPRTVTESLDVTQGKLALGLRFDPGEDFDLPSALTLNAVLGGMTTSKLFLSLRERLSLCYFAMSMLDRWKRIMIISSGIEFDNYQPALDEIKRQLEDCKNSRISPEEMENARQALASSLKATGDSQGRLEDYCLAQLVCTGEFQPPEDLLAATERVSPEDVAKTAASLELDEIYFLRD